MSTLKELIAKKDALELQIAEARKSEISEAIAKVHTIVSEYGLTADEIFPSGKVRVKGTTGTKVAPKYKDPVSGKTWTGRGMEPKWIQAKDRNKFSIV